MTAPESQGRTTDPEAVITKYTHRYDAAVEIVMNSGLMAPHLDDFWAFVDGKIDEAELRDRIR